MILLYVPVSDPRNLRCHIKVFLSLSDGIDKDVAKKVHNRPNEREIERLS